jgi:hypothetical protein
MCLDRTVNHVPGLYIVVGQDGILRADCQSPQIGGFPERASETYPPVNLRSIKPL